MLQYREALFLAIYHRRGQCLLGESRGTDTTLGSGYCPSGNFGPVRSDIDDLDIRDRAVCRLVQSLLTINYRHC